MFQKLTNRDIALFKYLHSNKVATTKHLFQVFFKRDISTARRRLIKLRKMNLLEPVCRDLDGDNSTVYSLTRKSFNLVHRIYPEECLIKRYRSNSVDHDLRLLEIKSVLQSKSLLSGYWTENILQSSGYAQSSLNLIPYINLQVDAVLRLGKKVEDHYYCGVEYEASLKSQSEYSKKVAAIYQDKRIHAILYITKDQEIQRRIKKTELEEAPKREKKIYFTQLEKITNVESKVTFLSQDNNILEIF